MGKIMFLNLPLSIVSMKINDIQVFNINLPEIITQELTAKFPKEEIEEAIKDIPEYVQDKDLHIGNEKVETFIQLVSTTIN